MTTTLRHIIYLAPLGRAVDAGTLLRSLYEHIVHFAWLAADPGAARSLLTQSGRPVRLWKDADAMKGLAQGAARCLLTIGARKEDLDSTRRLALVKYDQGLGCQPSGYAKRKHLHRLFRDRSHDILLESGTYLGDTVAYFAPHARLIASVELHPGLYKRAAQRFADIPNVRLHQGDAAEVIPRLVREVDAPPLIWLDGHYSNEATAYGAERDPAVTLLRKLGPIVPSGTTIVIDDLRLFGVEEDFPALDELLAVARETFPTATIRTGLDSLVIEN